MTPKDVSLLAGDEDEARPVRVVARARSQGNRMQLVEFRL